MIIHIKNGYQDEGLFRQEYHKIAFSGDISNRTKGSTNQLRASEKKNYLL
jgi:hypothetical protein